jgi:hypothetical protein
MIKAFLCGNQVLFDNGLAEKEDVREVWVLIPSEMIKEWAEELEFIEE